MICIITLYVCNFARTCNLSSYTVQGDLI